MGTYGTQRVRHGVRLALSLESEVTILDGFHVYYFCNIKKYINITEIQLQIEYIGTRRPTASLS